MIHRYGRIRNSTGRLAHWWPVLLCLLIVLVPTVCVLWFMTEAVENRRQVVQRTLSDADYAVARERLDNYWNAVASELDRCWRDGESAALAFQRCALDRVADGVALIGDDGRIAYPTTTEPHSGNASNAGSNPIDWERIEQIEHQQGDLTAAARAYEQIASTYGDPEKSDRFNACHGARALAALARCQVRAGQLDAAISTLLRVIDERAFHRVVYPDGRLIVAAAELRVLQLMADSKHRRFDQIGMQLAGRLNDYKDLRLPWSQRRFLMTELRQILPAVTLPTFEAEQVTAEFCEAGFSPSNAGVIAPAQRPGFWQLASLSGRVCAVFQTETVRKHSVQAVSGRAIPSGATVQLMTPGEMARLRQPPQSAEAGQHLQGWRLLRVSDSSVPHYGAPDAQVLAYFWTGILVIVATVVFALVMAWALRRQTRRARLRSNLVATVSHELKTPLAAIRLLVESLLDESELEEGRVREYLQLMSKENSRLSRLIDNFLAFSRMERGRQAFEFAEVNVIDVFDAAVEAAGDRLQQPDCQLKIDLAPNLPPIRADKDAIVTVLLNLIDNALKYSPDQKHIALGAVQQDDCVSLQVVDSGIGIPAAQTKKIFRRFYQVDQRIARETDGVGLGLSIVKFVVDAHGGSVTVDSRPGHGSTFSVSMPVAAEHSNHRQ